MTTITLHAPSVWPFPSPVVPQRYTPSKRAYVPDFNGLIYALPEDVSALIGFGFYLYGSSSGPLASLSDVSDDVPAEGDVVTRIGNKYKPVAPSSSGPLTVTDGSTTVSPATTLSITGATVTDGGSGEAQLTIGNPSSENITSGASVTTCNVAKGLSIVTSGGTAGDEHVVLPNFATDANGIAAEKNGFIHTVYLTVQTDPADVVRVFSGTDGSNILIRDRAGYSVAIIDGSSGVVLDYPGALAMFIWCGNAWTLDRTMQNDDSTVNRIYKPPATDPNDSGALWNNAGTPAISSL